MPSPPQAVLLTPRDLDILAALDRCPLTAEQLLTLSQTFALPFTDERRVRERLQLLCTAGRVRRWCYATAGRGALGYYTLSPLGYRLLHDRPHFDAPKRAFGPVGHSRQYHTLRLADFIVHLCVAAKRAGLSFQGFYRENSFRLPVRDQCIYPDCAFQLVTPSGFAFSFFVELDNSTEVIRSDQDRDTWERKIRLYDAFQDITAKRFRVLAVTTRSTQRTRHILETAKAVLRNPQRTLIYGIGLSEFLAQPEALTAACFRDHLGRRRPLVWQTRTQPELRPARTDPCHDRPTLWYPPPPVAASASPTQASEPHELPSPPTQARGTPEPVFALNSR